MIPIFDAHLDLAHFGLVYDRPITMPVIELRRRQLIANEQGLETPTTSLPDMRAGHVFACLTSVYSRARDFEIEREQPSRFRKDLSTPEQAYGMAAAQIAYYQLMEQRGEIKIITDGPTLAQLLEDSLHYVASHAGAASLVLPRKPVDAPPIGCVLDMEGCDPITQLSDVEYWWGQGIRMAALVHLGSNKYACGNESEGPLTAEGRELVAELRRVGMILDLSHASEGSMFDAMDIFDGPVCATHSNCRKFCSGNRQITDEQIKAIVQRDGVIGAVVFNSFIGDKWGGKAPSHEDCGLNELADHIDHVCQIAGDARHAAIGSDLDGGFGLERIPRELDTIADLQKLAPVLSARGYKEPDIAAIFHGNWMRFLCDALPDE